MTECMIGNNLVRLYVAQTFTHIGWKYVFKIVLSDGNSNHQFLDCDIAYDSHADALREGVDALDMIKKVWNIGGGR